MNNDKVCEASMAVYEANRCWEPHVAGGEQGCQNISSSPDHPVASQAWILLGTTGPESVPGDDP